MIRHVLNLTKCRDQAKCCFKNTARVRSRSSRQTWGFGFLPKVIFQPTSVHVSVQVCLRQTCINQRFMNSQSPTCAVDSSDGSLAGTQPTPSNSNLSLT